MIKKLVISTIIVVGLVGCSNSSAGDIEAEVYEMCNLKVGSQVTKADCLGSLLDGVSNPPYNSLTDEARNKISYYGTLELIKGYSNAMVLSVVDPNENNFKSDKKYLGEYTTVDDLIALEGRDSAELLSLREQYMNAEIDEFEGFDLSLLVNSSVSISYWNEPDTTKVAALVVVETEVGVERGLFVFNADGSFAARRW